MQLMTLQLPPDCHARAKPQAPAHLHSSAAYQSSIPEQHGLTSNRVWTVDKLENMHGASETKIKKKDLT